MVAHSHMGDRATVAADRWPQDGVVEGGLVGVRVRRRGLEECWIHFGALWGVFGTLLGALMESCPILCATSYFGTFHNPAGVWGLGLERGETLLGSQRSGSDTRGRSEVVLDTILRRLIFKPYTAPHGVCAHMGRRLFPRPSRAFFSFYFRNWHGVVRHRTAHRAFTAAGNGSHWQPVAFGLGSRRSADLPKTEAVTPELKIAIN